MTDPRGDVGMALATMQARCVVRGIDLSDYERLAEKVTTWDDWWDQWTAMGEHYLGLADRYQAAGWPTSAGAARVRAGIAFHFGKALAVQDDARYRDLTIRSVEAVAAGLRLMDPTFERIEVPFDGHQVVGNLRRPRGIDRAAARPAHPRHRVGQGGVPPVGGGVPQPRDGHPHHGRPGPG